MHDGPADAHAVSLTSISGPVCRSRVTPPPVNPGVGQEQSVSTPPVWCKPSCSTAPQLVRARSGEDWCDPPRSWRGLAPCRIRGPASPRSAAGAGLHPALPRPEWGRLPATFLLDLATARMGRWSRAQRVSGSAAEHFFPVCFPAAGQHTPRTSPVEHVSRWGLGRSTVRCLLDSGVPREPAAQRGRRTYFRGAAGGRWMCQSLRPHRGQVFPPTVLIIRGVCPEHAEPRQVLHEAVDLDHGRQGAGGLGDP